MSARRELDAARQILAQMDPARGPDKAKADLIAVWSAVEAALRSLVGGSVGGGQSLIRDARSRQLLTFDQANALVAFLTAREQMDRPDYVPTEADVNAARTAFLKLDAGLMSMPDVTPPAVSPYAPGGIGTSPASVPYASPSPTGAYGSTARAAAAPAPVVTPVVEPAVIRKRPKLWIPILAAVLIFGAIAAGWMLFRPAAGDNEALNRGIQAYQSGDRMAAASAFEQAARAMPKSALPHVYLSRMAREVGNYTVANDELQLGLKKQPGSLEGRREYGSLFLAQGNYDYARNWYTRALEINAEDKPSQGWLGCSLLKLGRVDEGRRFITRAGSGPWSACTPATQPAVPGRLPPP